VKRLFLKVSSAAVAAALLKACGGGGGDAAASAPPPIQPNNRLTLLQTAQGNAEFSTLVYALERAGLSGALNDAAANLTLFAADNAAFDALASRIGQGNGRTLVDTLAGTGHLADLLNFHLLPGQLAQSQLSGRPGTLYTFDGSPAELIFVNEGGVLNIWDASGRTNTVLTQADVQASNGVMHVISAVLVPRGVLTVSQMVRANDQYSSLFSAALTPTLIQEIDIGNITLFVPRDDAANGNVPLTTKVMRHHMVRNIIPGTSFDSASDPAFNMTTLINQTIRLTPVASGFPQLSDSTTTRALVVDSDFYATNGVIHTINKRLVPSGGT
jgi:transforming growth factor-beta-induced protein